MVRQDLFASSSGRRSKRRASRARPASGFAARRQLTALDAIRAYNQLLFSMEQLRVIRTNVQSKQTHVDYARNRRAAGVATELEVLRAEVDLENARAEALRADNEVSGARALLNTVMLRPTATPVVPTDSLAVAPFAAEFDAAVKSDRARPSCSCAHAGGACRRCWSCHPADMNPASTSPASTVLPSATANLFEPDFSRWSAAIKIRVPLFAQRKRDASHRRFLSEHREAPDCGARKSDSPRGAPAFDCSRSPTGRSGRRADRRAGPTGKRK